MLYGFTEHHFPLDQYQIVLLGLWGLMGLSNLPTVIMQPYLYQEWKAMTSSISYMLLCYRRLCSRCHLSSGRCNSKLTWVPLIWRKNVISWLSRLRRYCRNMSWICRALAKNWLIWNLLLKCHSITVKSLVNPQLFLLYVRLQYIFAPTKPSSS